MVFRALLMGALMAMAAGWVGELREDELHCEEAVAKLASCCPDFHPEAISCSYADACGQTQYPALSLAASQCIRDMDCETIVQRNVCPRVQAAEPVIIDQNGDVNGTNAGVCP